MATVRITDNFCAVIHNHITGNMRTQSLEAETELSACSYDMTELEQMVNQSLWPSVELRDMTPDSWCHHVDRFDVYFGDNDTAPAHKGFVLNEYFNVGTKLKVPCHLGQYSPEVEVPYSVWKAYPSIAAYVDGHATRKELLDQHYTKWVNIAAQVTTFLRQHASLNSAAKAWEGVLLYMPKDVIERLNQKVVRSKKDEDDDAPDNSDINFDELLVVGASVKIMGGA